MATPTSTVYSAASGATIYGGRVDPAALPSWVPAEGTFANISLNTMYSVRPTGWPNSDISSPFGNWSGGVFSSDFSALGAFTVYGSGHLSSGNPLWAGVWHFNLSTRMWEGSNVPAAPVNEQPPNSAFYNANYESLDSTTLGHCYVPHTYDGNVYQPAAQGGGTKGSLITNFFAGVTGAINSVHKFDLSSPSAPAALLISNLTMTGSAASYSATAADMVRGGGYWVMSGDGHGPLKFVTWAGAATTYTGVEFNQTGNTTLVHDPVHDKLIAFTSAAGTLAVYESQITGGVPANFVLKTCTGTAPSDTRCGGVWSTLLGKIVTYIGAGSYTVFKLDTVTYAWTSETLTGVAGATPSQCPSATNGTWGRFMEAPAARCFVFCDGVTQPVQAWRLTGM